jgi:hypothetical protein
MPGEEEMMDQMPPEEEQGPPEEEMGPEGQAPEEQQAPPPPDPQQIQQQLQQVSQQLQQTQMQEMQLNVKIENLKNEMTGEKIVRFYKKNKLAEFALDVETDFETLEDDPQIVQERMQFLDIFIKTVQQAIPMMQQDPAVADLIAGMVSFTLDGFKMGRSQRGLIDEYLFNIVENIKIQSQMPKPEQPNPEQIKAQALLMEAQAKMQQAQIAMQKIQVEAQQESGNLSAKTQHEMQKLQMQLQAQAERAQEKLQTDTNLLQLKIQADDNRYAKKSQADMLKAQMQERNKLRLAEKKAAEEAQKAQAAMMAPQMEQPKGGQ